MLLRALHAYVVAAVVTLVSRTCSTAYFTTQSRVVLPHISRILACIHSSAISFRLSVGSVTMRGTKRAGCCLTSFVMLCSS